MIDSIKAKALMTKVLHSLLIISILTNASSAKEMCSNGYYAYGDA